MAEAFTRVDFDDIGNRSETTVQDERTRTDVGAAARRAAIATMNYQAKLPAGSPRTSKGEWTTRSTDRGHTEAAISMRAKLAAADALSQLDEADISKRGVEIHRESKKIGHMTSPVAIRLHETSYLFDLSFRDAIQEFQNGFMDHYFTELLGHDGEGTPDQYERMELGIPDALGAELLQRVHQGFLEQKELTRLHSSDKPKNRISFNAPARILRAGNVRALCDYLKFQLRDEYYERLLEKTGGDRQKALKLSGLSDMAEFDRLEKTFVF